MLRMFELGTKDKEGQLSAVPDFDKLSEFNKQLIKEHIEKVDRLCALNMEIQELIPDDENIYSTL